MLRLRTGAVIAKIYGLLQSLQQPYFYHIYHNVGNGLCNAEFPVIPSQCSQHRAKSRLRRLRSARGLRAVWRGNPHLKK